MANRVKHSRNQSASRSENSHKGHVSDASSVKNSRNQSAPMDDYQNSHNSESGRFRAKTSTGALVTQGVKVR